MVSWSIRIMKVVGCPKAPLRDIVGIYMNPPANAAVVAVDEKSQIQALERAQPILPMDLGQPNAGPTTTSAM